MIIALNRSNTNKSLSSLRDKEIDPLIMSLLTQICWRYLIIIIKK